MTKIFISYRRDDTAGETGRLRDHLAAHFGSEELFLDIDTIEPGTDFAAAIERALEQSMLCLVVIGRRWFTPAESGPARRIDDPEDLVHLEVRAGLKRGIPVIPVLVQGARMPSEGDLPEALTALASRQAVTIDHDEFRADVQRLIAAIDKQLGPRLRGGARAGVRRRWRTGAALAVVAVAAGVFFCWPRTSGTAAPSAIAPQLAIAAEQQGRKQYPEAWQTLEDARRLAADDPALQTAFEDLAMDWLRNIRAPQGQTFTGIVPPLERALDRGSVTAAGGRRADLLAHLGWSAYLRYKEGDHTQDPPALYRRALEVDRTNPYAHAMLGHWLLYRGPLDLPGAREHFRAAVGAGRALEDVRALQLAALQNASREDEAGFELLRVANEMRLAGQVPDDHAVSSIRSVYMRVLASYTRTQDDAATAAIVGAMPGADHLATFRWLFEGRQSRSEIGSLQRSYYRGLLEEAAGERAAAIATLEAVASELEREGITQGTMFDQTNKALQRLRR